MRNAGSIKAALACLVLSTLGVMMSSAQTLQTLVTFDRTNGYGPSQGPMMRAANGDVYGTTYVVGTQGGGTLFQITPTGAFTTVYDFCCTFFSPNGVIMGGDGNFYGTSMQGGAYRDGTLFQLTQSGILNVLHSFCSLANCADGMQPRATLVQGSDGNFYGTTAGGGAQASGGTVFQLTPPGNLTTLYEFCSLSFCPDGYFPTVMIQGSDGNFYGITQGGGERNAGTVFKITPTGVLTSLYSFCSLANCADGSDPGALVQGSDGNFYGTTIVGGYSQCNLGCGTIFQLTPSGTLTTLYSFCSIANCADGSAPQGLRFGSDGNIYGTTGSGGANRRSNCTKIGCGTFFQLTRNGVLTTLYNFCSLWGCTDGASPLGLLQISRNTFYGTTSEGGSSCSCGTVWSWSSGVALAPTFTPASLNFGNQAIDTTSITRSVTIKNVNTGFATLDFRSFAVNPPFAISSNTCGATLAAGKTCAVKITFTPTALGASSGTLSVADNAPGSPQTVPLSGTGVAQATVTPTSLAFGSVKVGNTSAAKKVTLKNSLPTTLTGISYSTAAPFAVSASTCGTTLASKTSCTIGVTFSPTTIGPASGTLSVTDSANNSPQTVSLTGTGD